MKRTLFLPLVLIVALSTSLPRSLLAQSQQRWPEDKANAPLPPSIAAIRCSNTSVVGFMIRV